MIVCTNRSVFAHGRCPHCGEPRPDNFLTCGRARCQDAEYEKRRAAHRAALNAIAAHRRGRT
jgi:hypothetical protein